MNTFVVTQIEKGNWEVATGANTVTGFKNWVEAETFARQAAIDTGSQVVRLSATDRRIVSHFTPTAAAPACATANLVQLLAPVRANPASTVDFVDSLLGDDSTDDEVVAPDATTDFVDDLLPTVIDLSNLPTTDLVAMYNAAGGNIQGRYKGSRKALIEKIEATA